MNRAQQISEQFAAAHPEDAARILEGLDLESSAEYLAASPVPVVAGLIRQMDPFTAARCLEALSPESAALIAQELALDLVSRLLRRMDDSSRQPLLDRVPKEIAHHLQLLLRYPEGSAGAIMDPRILALPIDLTAGEALERVRHRPQQAIYYLYVVRRDDLLAGVLSVRDLMLAEPEAPLATIMRTNVARLSAAAGRAAIVSHPGWRSYHALPVVDENGVFLGAIRYETLRQLEADEADRAGSGVSSSSTGAALGELYWVGLSGIVEGLASSMGKRQEN